jgi:arsenite methyltransferase
MNFDYLSTTVDWSHPDIVSAYDELSLWSAAFGQMLLHHVPMRREMKVLDIGYGTGFPLLELAERLGETSRVYGVDPWETARQRALVKAEKWQVPNAEILPGDASMLPFSANMFDLIVSNLGINNFSNPLQVMQECARVARPNAHLAITTNLQGHMHEFYTIFSETLLETGRAALLPALSEHIAHRATISGVEILFQSAGFRLVKTVEETSFIRFVDGSALLRHHFIRLGFLDAWKAILPRQDWEIVFAHLEENLNRLAEEKGEITLTIPMVYMEGEING